jgi:hypothetical protein
MLIKARFDARMPDRHYPRQTKGTTMHATAKAFSNTVRSTPPGFDILETVALFCGVGLLIVLVLVLFGSSALPTEPQALNVMNWI